MRQQGLTRSVFLGVIEMSGQDHQRAELEKTYDRQFAVVFEAIRQLMEPPKGKKNHLIGFHPR
jgi:hypothetical protein